MWRITVAVAGLLCFSTNISAQPNKKLYELQERCGKRAAEVFTLEYSSVADSKDGQTLFNYENHCSARLNKCFFLEIAVSYEKEKSTSSKIMRLELVIDLTTAKALRLAIPESFLLRADEVIE